MRLSKESVLTFGINNGYKVSEIFQLYPEYIQWIMEKHNSAYIDDPDELINTIHPTPFPSFSIEEQFRNLPNEIEGIYFKPNSVAYARIFLKKYSLLLDSFTTDYNLRMQNAYEICLRIYKSELELNRLDPINHPIPNSPPDKPLLLINVKFEFSENSIVNNLIKKLNSRSK